MRFLFKLSAARTDCETNIRKIIREPAILRPLAAKFYTDPYIRLPTFPRLGTTFAFFEEGPTASIKKAARQNRAAFY